jgi:LacI family transcriptional regulator
MSRPQPAELRRSVTRADVARYAGVSSAVVSYVVNNGPKRVAPATAARVREAIAVLGYRPNLSARALKRGSTQMLGLVVHDSSNPFFGTFALEITVEAARRGYVVLMINSRADIEMEQQALDDLVGRQVDGVILASTQPLAFGLSHHSSAVPAVLIDSSVAVPGHFSLGPDALNAARLVVEHLIEVHGHTSIGIVIGNDGSDLDRREEGWQIALHAAGLPDGPIARTPFSREGGYRGGRRLLASRDRPTAIFASSDLQAVGLLKAIREQGLSVPADIAVVSFDGTAESEYCSPPLTVVRQPIAEMAIRAVDRLLAKNVRPGVHEKFTMELVVRESCGCPRAKEDE